MVEALRDAMRDRRLERVVVQDVLVNEGRKLRLTARDILRFLADAHPHRVDDVQPFRGPGFLLGHRILLRRLDPIVFR